MAPSSIMAWLWSPGGLRFLVSGFGHERLGCAAGGRRGPWQCRLPRGRKAEENALDVAVDDGDGFAEGDGGDGGAGVLADAGSVRRASAAACGSEPPRSSTMNWAALCNMRADGSNRGQTSGEHLCFCRQGERDDRGKPAQEAVVVLEDGGDARLLQHDLGDPGPVGIGDAAPRKFAGVSAIPVHQTAAKGGWVEFCKRRGMRCGRVDELEPGACWHAEDSLPSPA